MAFPASPSNNQVHSESNRTFVYDSTLGTWDQVAQSEVASRLSSNAGGGNIGNIVTGTLENSVGFPSGHIVNVQSATETADHQTTNVNWTQVPGLFVDVGNIQSTSSRFFIQCHLNCGSSPGANAGGAFKLWRNGSDITGMMGNASGNRTRCAAQTASGSSGWVMLQRSITYVDSPATITPIVYSVAWRCESTTNGSFLNKAYDDGNSSDRTRGASSLTVMEIV